MVVSPGEKSIEIELTEVGRNCPIDICIVDKARAVANQMVEEARDCWKGRAERLQKTRRQAARTGAGLCLLSDRLYQCHVSESGEWGATAHGDPRRMHHPFMLLDPDRTSS